MIAEIDFIVQPYATADGRSVLDRLVIELGSGEWHSFWAAAAFAKQSGNDRRLVEALKTFASEGGAVSITFGADLFGETSRGSDLDAVKTLLEAIGSNENVSLNLYHEHNRTFHPKVYLFVDSASTSALAIIGSSNWTFGGLVENVEANVVVRFDLTNIDHKASFDELSRYFNQYWTEST